MNAADAGSAPPRRRRMALAPGVPRWARERASLGVADLARKIPTKPGRVEEWESTGRTYRSHAERLARSTHTPFGHLLLKEPADESLPIADFRTRGADGPPAGPSKPRAALHDIPDAEAPVVDARLHG